MASQVVSPGRRLAQPVVDHSALRTNQVFIVASLAIAFVFNLPVLVVLVALVLVIGTLYPPAALLPFFYRRVLSPAGIARPDVHPEDPAPHRFTQGMAAAVLLIASVALAAGLAVVGWGLALVVIALALINLVFGFCAGCFIYFQLERLRASQRAAR